MWASEVGKKNEEHCAEALLKRVEGREEGEEEMAWCVSTT